MVVSECYGVQLGDLVVVSTSGEERQKLVGAGPSVYKNNSTFFI